MKFHIAIWEWNKSLDFGKGMVIYMEKKQIEEKQIEVVDVHKTGYAPLVDFEKWRVAVLKYCEDVRVDHILTMQKHEETDEVFVLLEGACILILGGTLERPDQIEFIEMKQNKIYNIKKGCWHNHVLNEAGSVLIVENQNTCDANSPIVNLTNEQREQLKFLDERI